MPNPSAPGNADERPPAVKAEATSFAAVIRNAGALRGMGLMIVYTAAMSAMSGIGRHLSDDMHPFEIAFFRNLFGFLVLSPVFLRHGAGLLRTRCLHLHALRGMLTVIGSLTFFLALQLTTLSKIAALDFSAPLFAAFVGLVVFRERARPTRIGALVAGFAGALVILRPGLAAIDLGAVLVLVGAASWGVALIVIKIVVRTDSPVAATIYATLFTTPCLLLAALFVWETPTVAQLAWLLVMGALGSLGHLTIAQAFKEADISAVLPLDFLKLVWMTLLGYALFQQSPDAWTLVGGTMIFAAALALAYGESRTASPGGTSPPPGRAGA